MVDVPAASVCAPEPTHMGRVHRGCTRGWMGRDQSEASILYPAKYLERMPHVRGVVWGYPLPERSPAPFFTGVTFCVPAATYRHANTLNSRSLPRRGFQPQAARCHPRRLRNKYRRARYSRRKGSSEIPCSEFGAFSEFSRLIDRMEDIEVRRSSFVKFKR